MALELWQGYPIIDERSDIDYAFRFGERGLVERDFSVDPIEMGDAPNTMTLYSESEWDALFEQQEEQESSLSHIYERAGWEPLNQNPAPYCWAHSVVHLMMLLRMRDNLPHVPLSAFSVAATIKKGAMQGGWCGLSMKFIREFGVMPQSIWPQQDANYRKYDQPENWKAALQYRPRDTWFDTSASVYSQKMALQQMATALFNNQPCAHDNMTWAHSVAILRMVRIEKGSWGLMCLNSWPGWGKRGQAILRGNFQRIDGAVGIRTTEM